MSAMYSTVACIILELQLTGSIVCESTTSDDPAFHKHSKFLCGSRVVHVADLQYYCSRLSVCQPKIRLRKKFILQWQFTYRPMSRAASFWCCQFFV